MKILSISAFVLSTVVGQFSSASSDLNCALRQRGAVESSVQLANDSQKFSYAASLNSVTAIKFR